MKIFCSFFFLAATFTLSLATDKTDVSAPQRLARLVPGSIKPRSKPLAFEGGCMEIFHVNNTATGFCVCQDGNCYQKNAQSGCSPPGDFIAKLHSEGCPH
ncbi:hypothetical protein M433DRAFT_157738 [Acidomyces richmondensis BFW]|nr:MAG: hypothetical protein FE78DRAFT_102800 [Acidomyces sp. 'richmondensis']KYG42559.1 hypothetical protein M433DRAFT_157738 [Acidomyces richmondensis BFW]